MIIVVGTDDLKRIVREIENRLQSVTGAESPRTRLTRDLNRAHLYMKALASGHADLIPERLSGELAKRYRSAKPDDTAAEDGDTQE